MRHPLKGIWWVESHFHSIKRPDHSGTDLIGYNPYCYAIEAGRIQRRFDDISGWGVNLVSLDGKRKWEYIHLFEAGRAPNGATVKEGERIGKWGETKVANVSGPHLHLGLEMPLGTQVDPYRFIEDHMNMNPSEDDVKDFFRLLKGLPGQTGVPTASQIANYTKQPWQVLAGDVSKTAVNAYRQTKKLLDADAQPLVRGIKYIAP